MLVYKYRGGTPEKFEIDLQTIEKNQFWASNLEQLIDPCEAMTDTRRIKTLFNLIAGSLGITSKEELKFIHNNTDQVLSLDGKMGIYALSKTYLDELLWAHYANSHKGFCLEYDLNILLKSEGEKGIYSFPVLYKKRPPKISYLDVFKSEADSVIRKFAFYKSKRWEYEKEHRIVTTKPGLNSYYYTALKAIYFGLRMNEADKNEIMNRLKGRGLKYYQIEQIKNTYNFRRIEIEEKYSSDKDYLQFIPISVTGNKRIAYQILKAKIHNYAGVGEFHIKLEQSIEKTQLQWLTQHLKENLFAEAKTLFFNYYTKTNQVNDLAWGYAQYQNENWETEINSTD